MNPATFDIQKIEARLETADKKIQFHNLMKLTTQLLSVSFLMSSVLNFVLSLRIFTPLDEALTSTEKQQILNEQLGQMTLYSLGVILVPSVLFLGGIMYFAFRRINQLTGLTTEELILKS